MSRDTTYEEVDAAVERFRHEWFDVLGGRREDGVRLAMEAGEAIFSLSDEEYDTAEQTGDIERWMDILCRCPEFEKDLVGIAEYRRRHRVKPELIARDQDLERRRGW